MPTFSKYKAAFSCSFTLILLGSILLAPLHAGRDNRPFWTEKSAFVEGDELFVVGVATNVRTPEEGRQRAFEHGKVELMNYAQVTDLEARGLVIETQMTHEEANSDGTFNVFRLLQVPAAKLVEIQERLQAQSRQQEQSLEAARTELAAVQESITRKQRTLELQTQEMEKATKTISALQTKLEQKAAKIEAQQKKVEQLLAKLSIKVSSGGAPPKASQLTKLRRGVHFFPLDDSLKQAEAQLDQRDRELQSIRKRIMNRITKESNAACEYVTVGMTPQDVKRLLGRPGGECYTTVDTGDTWTYGKAKVYFDDTGVVREVICQ